MLVGEESDLISFRECKSIAPRYLRIYNLQPASASAKSLTKLVRSVKHSLKLEYLLWQPRIVESMLKA